VQRGANVLSTSRIFGPQHPRQMLRIASLILASLSASSA
jgi:hypothetical protein